MTKPFIVFGAPSIGDEEISEVIDTMRSGWLSSGERVTDFEARFAEFKGRRENQAAAVNSCTAALHLALLAAGIGPGDEVITSPLTFCATANAILHTGATPVLADVDPLTMNIDPNKIEGKITSRTKALLPVHFAGLPCDMDSIINIANQHQLQVIEDCAHAVESIYRGQPTGTLGDFGCFSFYVTKNITTGEGGMVLARNAFQIERIKIMALHGMTRGAWKRFSDSGYKHYQVVAPGFKYNMMNLQAAIGLHQLDRVKTNWIRRQAIWCRYQDAFADLPVKRPCGPPSDVRHAYHLYTVLIDEEICGISREMFIARMTEKQIGVGVHYLALPEHPYYQESLGWQPEDTPTATKIGRQTVSLPLMPQLSDDDVERVIEAVTESVRKT
ncbi:MAG: DegT/DnrJ/EryC1/StrS family aminotransferase [Methylococcaceae bacterium]